MPLKTRRSSALGSARAPWERAAEAVRLVEAFKATDQNNLPPTEAAKPDKGWDAGTTWAFIGGGLRFAVPVGLGLVFVMALAWSGLALA